ncbi:hypothetical protein ATE48_09045 [Candidatus Viadribacter manganicus]|uniref:Type I restriction enzyme R protein N-terminal domain-containing protein n=1 Tax=Candidatus Viadribacter manganicus TaxID=1759059 RepID=A0A1B1AHL1_9PROT|nr:hypothetical protein ATE48_09045 [Candidatus Viadribacter manganicus]
MAMMVKVNAPTEAELESRIASALARALPHIPRQDLVQQRYFKLQMGHKTEDYDSVASWTLHGKADILIFYRERALAVLEIKRETISLTDADYKQAQSYANQITPRPPLVIVSNGQHTRVYDSNTGLRWTSDNDESVLTLLKNATKVAAADMRWAIEALMGRETDLWTRVVRGRTNDLINEMIDHEGNPRRPFAANLLFPRQITAELLRSLPDDVRFILIEGTPATGKTNVIRELALRTENSDKIAILMLRGNGPGLFQAIANHFAAELEWNLSPQDVRQWLRRLSRGKQGPALVLAVDGVRRETRMAEDLEELATMQLGDNLKIVITTDDAAALTRLPGNRGETALGVRARTLELGPLGLDEFRSAQQLLVERQIGFLDGAQYAEDYRAPWLLRAIHDQFQRDPQSATHSILLDATPGLGIFRAARDSIPVDADTARNYRLVARDWVADDAAQPGASALASSSGFVIRRDRLSQTGAAAAAALADAGLLAPIRLRDGQDVYAPTLPSSFMLELATVVGHELMERSGADPFSAGVWLGRRLDGTFLGDLIGAQAVVQAGVTKGAFSSGIISGLLSITPQEQLIDDAMIALAAEDGRLVYFIIKGGAAFECDDRGIASGEAIDLGAERSRMLEDTTAWMMLGHLAHVPSVADGSEARADASILLEIGTCPFPLMRVNELGLPHLEHDLGAFGRVLCTNEGTVEPTTQAIMHLLAGSWPHKEAWIAEAIAKDSLPLTHRIMLALRGVRRVASPDHAAWAEAELDTVVMPVVNARLAKASDMTSKASSG